MDQNYVLTIGLCGQTSAGKTSFMNAICGGFIGSVSLTRETVNIELVRLRVGAEYNFTLYEKEMIESKNNSYKWFELNNKIEFIIKQPNNPLSSLIGIDLDIIDFPRIDSVDDKYFEILKKNLDRLDILLYITSIESAFTTNNEIELFNEIKNIVNEMNTKKNFITLAIILNKIDNPYDIEHNHIIKYRIPTEIKEQNNIFRISCHKLFIHYLMINKIKRTFLHNEIFNELSKIIKNADVLVDSDMQNNIIMGNLVNFSNIKFNNIINNEDDKNYSGDYDNLIQFIINHEPYNISVMISRYLRRFKRYVIDLIKSNS